MQSTDIQAIREESARVGKLYMQRFCHPGHRRVSDNGLVRPLKTEESLQLMQEALEKGEPVPGWAETYESNKVTWASGSRVT
ncbi:hypothetical protein MASR1M60_14130 [Rhodocyclaceae bacterium]